jgi:hypothetical protein
MATFGEQFIAYAEHVPDGLLVVFVDGESAIYTASFLRGGLAEMKSRPDRSRSTPSMDSRRAIMVPRPSPQR